LRYDLKLIAVILVAVLSLAQSASADDWHFDNVDRVVAIADIHGAYDAMTATLQSAGVINADMRWVDGATHLVIVGDILDRGPDSRLAMDLLMRLEGEAESAGGKVHVLIGNHESMPMTGDLRYVSAAEYEAFAADEDPDERARWLELYVQQQAGDAATLKATFDTQFPVGYFAMRRAFRADGRYGKWLLEKNIIVVLNGTAFVHGGLSPLVAEVGLDGINRKQKSKLVDYVEALAILTDAEILLPTDSNFGYSAILTNYMPSLDAEAATLAAVKTAISLDDLELLSSSGPLWYRGSVACSEMVESHRLNAALAAIDAERVVVGHTPTPNLQVLQRFDGRLLEIDTGMLHFYYQGSGNALVLEGDSVSVINQASAATVPIEHPRQVGRRAGALTAGQIEEALAQGEIVSLDKTDAGSVARIKHNGQSISAIFSRRKSRGFYPAVAAYQLDRLLDLDMVPVTVVREVDGRDGSLQFLPMNISNEKERVATGAGGGAHCPISEQWQAMYIFDALIYNEGRTTQQMIYDKVSWQLILGGHDKTFANKKGRPPYLAQIAVVVNQSWKDALATITDDVLQEQFADILDKRRLTALASRRDELLSAAN
jgi:hypothetical protein